MSTRRVIKVGTSLLRGDASRSTEQVIADLASSLSGLWQRGEPVALVTSGAVGLGCHALGQAQRPSEVEALQAAAAVGQGRLMTLYDQAAHPRRFGFAAPLPERLPHPRATARLGRHARDQ